MTESVPNTQRVWNVVEVVAAMRERAEASGLRIIDLGQGTPIDPTPEVVRDALAAASNWPGYPPAHGTPDLREAYSRWAGRRWRAAVDPTDVLVTAGSKEFIATLPWLLGLGKGDTVVVPELAYPTYRAGALATGCAVIAADATSALGPQRAALMWLNTPGNPTGRVLPAEHLAKTVTWARERGVLLVSDECYVELTGPALAAAPSVLSPEVNGGSLDGILAVHSMSKRSHMAGYRVGLVSGDAAVVARVLKRRRDTGLLAAGPAQAAARAALDDDEHVDLIKREYARRRGALWRALSQAGFTIDDSEAGLFIWATLGESDDSTAGRLADLGILVAPGGFYGPRGARHVRFSLTASPEDLAEVAQRLTRWAGGGPRR